MTRYDKILGGLLGGAIGDAMGAATETRTTAQIIERFGGLVKDFIAPPDDVFAHGWPKGSVTDDFSLAYCTAEAIIRSGGVITDETAKDALISWGKTPYFVMAGPTTVACVDRLLGKPPVPNKYDFLSVDNSKGSNGSAMKIGPVGLVSGGDVDKAIADTITICKPTHFNSTALSGGCATSAAVAKALDPNANVFDLVQAGLYGAKVGEQHGAKLANPSVYKRINLAVEIALKADGDMEKCMCELTDIIGSGLSCAEAVPCAFGLLVAAKGDPMEAIYGGVNIGSDTDTVATIVGSIAGTLKGAAAFDPAHMKLINEVNNYDLEMIARELDRLS